MKQLLLRAGFLLMLVACQAATPIAPPAPSVPPAPLRTIVITSPSGERLALPVELARTHAELERGLMYRETVQNGMLFLFDSSSIQRFWMKNTLVPLDIVFFGADGRFVYSATMTPCKADPCPLYISDAPSQYVLEEPEGFLAGKGIAKGWTLELPMELR